MNTGNEFMDARMERMISGGSMTNSYKILWLRGIFEEVLAGSCEIPLKRITVRMCAAAWYSVSCFRLSFGSWDKMPECVTYIQGLTGLAATASVETVVETIYELSDNNLSQMLEERCRYVPHLLIRCFYEKELRAEQERLGRHLTNTGIMNAIISANASGALGAPYVFNEERSGLVVAPEWVKYFRENRYVIQGWLDMRFVNYLQSRNPSVPAIPLKVHPPMKRDLGAATKYWKEAVSAGNMAEIYSGVKFCEEGYHMRGPLSIDHFIPWSFVMHDEPWNLVPMFRNENSAKGDRLPDLETFLAPFARQQFDALMLTRNTVRHRKILEAYLEVDENLLGYENRRECFDLFENRLGRVIRPLHQIAENQGFPIWVPSALRGRASLAVFRFRSELHV